MGAEQAGVAIGRLTGFLSVYWGFAARIVGGLFVVVNSIRAAREYRDLTTLLYVAYIVAGLLLIISGQFSSIAWTRSTKGE